MRTVCTFYGMLWPRQSPYTISTWQRLAHSGLGQSFTAYAQLPVLRRVAFLRFRWTQPAGRLKRSDLEVGSVCLQGRHEVPALEHFTWGRETDGGEMRLVTAVGGVGQVTTEQPVDVRVGVRVGVWQYVAMRGGVRNRVWSSAAACVAGCG